MRHHIKDGRQGFTIVELMIATTVLSIILLLATVVLISIGNLYYKGVNTSRLQDNVRGLSDEIGQQLELDGGTFLTNTGSSGGHPTTVYCVGNYRYFFVEGVQIGSQANQIAHALWRDTNPEQGSCTFDINGGVPSPPGPGIDLTDVHLDQDDAANSGTELMAPRSRLVDLSINPSTSPYNVDVYMAYGDDDLLCSPTVIIGGTNSCNSSATMPLSADFAAPNQVKCKGSSGDQFCATGNLSSIVVKRLN